MQNPVFAVLLVLQFLTNYVEFSMYIARGSENISDFFQILFSIS
jgi:hypothetical protein